MKRRVKGTTKRQDKDRDGMLAGLTVGHAQAETDKRLSVDRDRGRTVALLDVAAIRPRAADARPPRAVHVLALAESVAAVGLLQPPAVDKAGRLIAGLHRLEACRLLLLPPEARTAHLQGLDGGERLAVAEVAERCHALPLPGRLDEPLRAGKVPCRVLVDLDAEADPAGALAAEAAENTARRAYTAAEVGTLATRLRAAGYREAGGRPRKGEKALRPALELVLGVSKNTARRLLGRMETGKRAQMGTFSDSCARLHRALCAFGEAAGAARGIRTPAQRLAVKAAAALAELLGRMLDAERKADADE
jgi:ParB family chromosome partitioning protein